MKSWIEISSENLKHNLREFDKILPKNVRIMTVVKSNAYGHGLLLTAKIFTETLKEREIWLGVDSVYEGEELRKAGISIPILVLGYTPIQDLVLAAKYDLRLTIYNKEACSTLAKLDKKTKVHIKLDTGTTRQGVGENEAVQFVEFVKRMPNIELEGLSTHYANIEDTTDHAFAALQLKRFIKIASALENAGIKIPFKHTACSAAAIVFPETHFNMARLGISLYGYWPSGETKVSAREQGIKISLKPALVWKTIIAQLREVPAGTPISYGLTEKTKRQSRIAVLPVGYFDGYDRGLSSIGEVLIKDQRCKVLGRICMNMLMVDATDCKDATLEDKAILLGAGTRDAITAEEMAKKVNTINYEIITRINPLIPRILV